MFVDASAILGMLAREEDALVLADQLEGPGPLLWSAIVQWEAVAALTRIRRYDPSEARSEVYGFGREWTFKLVGIGEWESEMAFGAFRLYGKRRGHPAQLNLGDCFSYACAKANQARLLYKGKDFARTDLA